MLVLKNGVCSLIIKKIEYLLFKENKKYRATMEAIIYTRSINHIHAMYEDSKEGFICVYLDKDIKNNILYGNSNTIVPFPEANIEPSIAIQDTPDVAYDEYEPYCVIMLKGTMNIHNIANGSIRRYTGKLFNNSDRLYICRGNVYFSIANQKNVLGLLKDNTKLTYEGRVHSIKKDNMIIVDKIGKLSKYTHVDLNTGKESLIFKTYIKVDFYYCNGQRAVYSEYSEKMQRLVQHDLVTDTKKYLNHGTYIISSFGDDGLLAAIGSGVYLDLENGTEVMAIGNNSTIPFLRRGIYDESYRGCYRIHYVDRIGNYYYGNVSRKEPDEIFMSRFGICYICRKMNPCGVYCQSNNDKTSKSRYLYCEYTHRDLVAHILERLPVVKDINSHIYSFLFGKIQKVERYERFEQLGKLYASRPYCYTDDNVEHMKRTLSAHGHDAILKKYFHV